MVHLDHKYFIPFPEYFRGKIWDSEVYLGIDLVNRGIPVSININFTKSEDLEGIKASAQKDYEETKNMDLPYDVKLAIQKNYEKLHNEEPSASKFKIKFESGEEGYNFSEQNQLLTILVEGSELPDPEKSFFYPADV